MTLGANSVAVVTIVWEDPGRACIVSEKAKERGKNVLQFMSRLTDSLRDSNQLGYLVPTPWENGGQGQRGGGSKKHKTYLGPKNGKLVFRWARQWSLSQ